MQVSKIGHAAFETWDVEAMLRHYTEVLGLTLSERGSDGTCYLASAVEHHSITLYPAETDRLHHVAFQLGGDLSVDDAAGELGERGVKVEKKTDAEPGIPELLEIADSEGNAIELYAETEGAEQGFQAAGIVPEKLGHVAHFVEDAQRMTDFYEEVLGFRWSDWMEDFFVFLRCNTDHHTMNFLRSRHKGMHHIGFQLQDWSHVESACDLLAEHEIPLVWGPGRHGIGHNIFAYYRDPAGNVVELFTELDLMLDENLGYFDPRPWHEDLPQRPKVWKMTPQAANKWGVMPPEGFMGE